MASHPLTFPCPHCGRRMGVGLELAGRRVRCPLCREVVTAPVSPVGPVPAPVPRPPTDRGPEGVESIFADPAESEDSVIGGGQTHRKPIPPSDTEVTPVTTPRSAPRTAVPFVVKPPGSHQQPAAQPLSTEAPPPAEEGSPFVGLGGDPLPAPGKSKRQTQGKGSSVQVWVWVVVAALAGYGIVMTVVAVLGWMR